jgi:hypothetical protein
MDIVNVRIVPENIDIKRVIIRFGLTAGLTVALIWVQRKAASPDFILTQRMRVLHTIARYADSQAKVCESISAKATKLYLESRP